MQIAFNNGNLIKPTLVNFRSAIVTTYSVKPFIIFPSSGTVVINLFLEVFSHCHVHSSPQSCMQTSTDIAFNLAAINRAACNWYNFSIALFIYKLGSFL
jgi:hypothetical protein